MFAGRGHIAIHIYFGRLGMYLYPGIENLDSKTVFACFRYAIQEHKGVRHRFPSIVSSEDVELHIVANCCFVFLWCKPELEG